MLGWQQKNGFSFSDCYGKRRAITTSIEYWCCHCLLYRVRAIVCCFKGLNYIVLMEGGQVLGFNGFPVVGNYFAN